MEAYMTADEGVGAAVEKIPIAGGELGVEGEQVVPGLEAGLVIVENLAGVVIVGYAAELAYQHFAEPVMVLGGGVGDKAFYHEIAIVIALGAGYGLVAQLVQG